MKVLPISRILLVDSQKERRESLRLELLKFGLGDVLEAQTLDAVSGPALPENTNLLVVQADDPDLIFQNPYRDGGGIPAILIVDLPQRELERASVQGGYEAALGMPLSPRILYRRIGSVLQQARRTSRAMTPLQISSVTSDATGLPSA